MYSVMRQIGFKLYFVNYRSGKSVVFQVAKHNCVSITLAINFTKYRSSQICKQSICLIYIMGFIYHFTVPVIFYTIHALILQSTIIFLQYINAFHVCVASYIIKSIMFIFNRYYTVDAHLVHYQMISLCTINNLTLSKLKLFHTDGFKAINIFPLITSLLLTLCIHIIQFNQLNLLFKKPSFRTKRSS